MRYVSNADPFGPATEILSFGAARKKPVCLPITTVVSYSSRSPLLFQLAMLTNGCLLTPLVDLTVFLEMLFEPLIASTPSTPQL
jgi:hypothetical protein